MSGYGDQLSAYKVAAKRDHYIKPCDGPHPGPCTKAEYEANQAWRQAPTDAAIAGYAKFEADCIAAVQQESQERADAPNLQISADPVSSDGAEVAELKRILAVAQKANRMLKLSQGRCARERDSAIASSQQAHADAAASESNLEEAKRVGAQICKVSVSVTAKHHAALGAAAAQFRAITGDFPGLDGPLVDLFKDVK